MDSDFKETLKGLFLIIGIIICLSLLTKLINSCIVKANKKSTIEGTEEIETYGDYIAYFEGEIKDVRGIFDTKYIVYIPDIDKRVVLSSYRIPYIKDDIVIVKRTKKANGKYKYKFSSTENKKEFEATLKDKEIHTLDDMLLKPMKEFEKQMNEVYSEKNQKNQNK